MLSSILATFFVLRLSKTSDRCDPKFYCFCTKLDFKTKFFLVNDTYSLKNVFNHKEQQQTLHHHGAGYQRWNRGHKARGQGQEHKNHLRPRTALPRNHLRQRTGMLEAKDKYQVHRRKCSPKKKSSKKIFRRSPKEEYKRDFRKFSTKFLAFSNTILRIQQIVLSSSRGRGNFRGLEALRPRTWPSRPRTSKCVF